MSKTVKRVLWQRTLETAGPLRKALPVASASAPSGISERLAINVRFDTSPLRAALAKLQPALKRLRDDIEAASPHCGAGLAQYLCWYDPTEFRRQEDGSMKPFRWSRGSYITGPVADLSCGGLRGRNPSVCLVGESGPELVVKIPAGKLKAGEPAGFDSLADAFLLALPQMVREINEA